MSNATTIVGERGHGMDATFLNKQKPKVVIVGAESKYWENIPNWEGKVTQKIVDLLYKEAATAKCELTDITIISGKCPTAKCLNCGSTDFAKESDPITGFFKCEKCTYHSKIRTGGVDILAEIAADSLGLNKSIHPPEVNQWLSMHQCPVCKIKFDRPSDVTKHAKTTHNKNAFELRPIRLNGFMQRNINMATEGTIVYDIEPVIGHGDHFTVQTYNDLLTKYNCHGKPKFEIELTTKREKADLLGNAIDSISGLPLGIQTDTDGTWLNYQDGFARQIYPAINKWTAVYTSGGFWTYNIALKQRKKARLIAIE